MAVRRCKKEDLKRIARATGGRKGNKMPGQGGHISSDQHTMVLFQLRHTSHYICDSCVKIEDYFVAYSIASTKGGMQFVDA